MAIPYDSETYFTPANIEPQPLPKLAQIHVIYGALKVSTEELVGQTPLELQASTKVRYENVSRCLRQLHAMGLAAAHKRRQKKGRPQALWYRLAPTDVNPK